MRAGGAMREAANNGLVFRSEPLGMGGEILVCEPNPLYMTLFMSASSSGQTAVCRFASRYRRLRRYAGDATSFTGSNCCIYFAGKNRYNIRRQDVMGVRMDEIDVKIVDILQQNARIANAEIARRVNMAPSAVLERIKKLEERRIIREYGARVDPGSVGLGLLAFVAVKLDYCDSVDTGELLAAIPGVLEVHNVAGDDCYLVKVRARNTEHLGRLLHEHFRNIPAIRSTNTTIVLATVKETNALPLQAK